MDQIKNISRTFGWKIEFEGVLELWEEDWSEDLDFSVEDDRKYFCQALITDYECMATMVMCMFKGDIDTIVNDNNFTVDDNVAITKYILSRNDHVGRFNIDYLDMIDGSGICQIGEYALINGGYLT